MRAFYAQYRLNYPVALGDATIAERLGGVLGMPAKFLIDRRGHIASKHAGAVDLRLLSWASPATAAINVGVHDASVAIDSNVDGRSWRPWFHDRVGGDA